MRQTYPPLREAPGAAATATAAAATENVTAALVARGTLSALTNETAGEFSFF
jgi:hypothetical protein